MRFGICLEWCGVALNIAMVRGSTHTSSHNSTSEGTPYHSNIESYTAPLKTDAESHLSSPPSTAPHPCSSLPQHTHRYYLILKPARMQLLFYYYHHITQPGVHSPLPTANYIPGHYYSLVLPNFTYLFSSA